MSSDSQSKQADPISVFHDVPEDFPIDLIPKTLSDFIAAVSHRYTVRPAAVGAAALVTAAAALGPFHWVDTWTPSNTPATLNFLLVGTGTRLQAALDSIIHPITREVLERSLEPAIRDPNTVEELRRHLAQEIAALEKAGESAMEAMERDGRLFARIRPELQLGSITCSRLRSALKRSMDCSLLIHAGNHDSTDHWFSLKGKERRALSEILLNSWHAKPPLNIAVPLHLPTLWRTSREKAPRLLKCQELFGSSGVPFFFVESEPIGPATPALAEPLEIEGLWQKLVKSSLRWRQCQKPAFYTFSPEGTAALIDYLNLVETRLTLLPSDLSQFVSFLPEAVRRLSLLFAIWAETLPETLPDTPLDCIHRESVEAAIGLIEWYGRESLRLAISLRHPEPRQERPPTTSSLREKMLHRVLERGPIRWRDLRRSFANASEAVLAPVRDQLIADQQIGWVEGSSSPELVAMRDLGRDRDSDGEKQCQTTVSTAAVSGAARVQRTEENV